MAHQPAEEPLPARSNPQQHTSAVLLGTLPPQQSALFHSIDQFHRAMMPDLQALRNVRIVADSPDGQTAYRQ